MSCTNYDSGTDVLLYVNISDSETDELEAVAGQRGLTRDSSADFINLSNKSTGAVTCGVQGRITKTVTLDGVFPISDDGMDALEDAHDNQTSITVAAYKGGVKVEEADGYVLSLSKNDPDNAESTFTVNIQLIEAWS